MDRATKNLRVLLIEDDAPVAIGIQRVLRSSGAECDHAATGGEGLALARENIYDVIVLDVNLPDIKGFDVAQKLRADGDLTPIQMLTGLADEVAALVA